MGTLRSRRERFAAFVVAMFVVTGSASLPSADANVITSCEMSASTPGFHAIRLDLPHGASFLSIEPQSKRPIRVSDDANWHLAQGLVVVNAATLEMAAARVETYGTAPRAAVVRTGSLDTRSQVVAPDAPFYHMASRPVPGLPPGTYYAIAFGTDGGESLPNEWWSFDLRVSGSHRCTSTGVGRIFDIDQTEFTGGSQVYVPGVGVAEDITHGYVEPAETDIVVGLMDAAVQGPGEAELDFTMPLASGELDDEIVPFVSTRGEHEFRATFSGAFPQILIAGVAVDVG
ncbi:MAG TPA: hypothetical protein VM600_02955 [Actinomycetota bacterium]|nr:hypothetical protein [Actinomycetota bacterium]